MSRFLPALALAALMPLQAAAQSADLGEHTKGLAAAIAAEGCTLTKANTDAVQAHLSQDMTDQDVMAGTVELITGGYLVQEAPESFRLKGLGC
ncbi:hypothetical protein HOY34_08475 [Xinfangfangia sp. D13-10-4-6]|uniref:hypothetical protein n=1 Tax=Pseudogemmobacter hezensis TaxID=2737662 RepID=UPI001552622E|nr:hypothetical protein [Pseudogemmobacter hezensis]NPD15232.1 hypothetical protein [Pseudogemmobacter hezensis]